MAERQWEIEIRAAPEVIYDLVSSIDRVPEFSPECRKTEWIGELREPVLGARFRGRNRWLGFTWWREVQITRAERGREFGFETVPARGIYHDRTKWRYRFEPTEAEVSSTIRAERHVGVTAQPPDVDAQACLAGPTFQSGCGNGRKHRANAD